MIKILIIINLVIALIDYVLCFLAAMVAKEAFYADFPDAKLHPKTFTTRLAEYIRAIITCLMPIVNIFVLFGIIFGWDKALVNTYDYLLERKYVVPKSTHTDI